MTHRTGLHQPLRTCIGCRERMPQSELIRLKLLGGKVVISRPGQDVPGRSIYLCPQQACWHAALKRSSLTFKASKHDRVTVRLEGNEQDQLILKLRRHVREERQRN